MASQTSLTVAVVQAIAYITRPLIVCFPVSTILKLQIALEANMTKHFASSWVPSEPLRGSGRRCLSFSPSTLPPRPIYNSIVAAGVQWPEWSAALGNVEFDLFVDPGRVSIRVGGSQLVTVWSEELEKAAQLKADLLAQEARLQVQLRAQEAVRAEKSKTLAQEIMQADEDSEQELFAALADEIRAPTWSTPIVTSFPPIAAPKPVAISPVSEESSRPSSRSSNLSSSGLSIFSEASEGASSVTSASTVPCVAEVPVAVVAPKLSRRERARMNRILIDKSKTQVQNYDGGKTKVLTGGVMFCTKPKAAPTQTKAAPTAAPKAQKAKATKGASASANWRTVRA
ncbi:hypothetical protein DENSPDRAFT_871953 [Dentipellis sp. KUC8613]|nr:hypothetical protein DENSPDRAFT_871953 [Dentipellis sp. KUC8613]